MLLQELNLRDIESSLERDCNISLPPDVELSRSSGGVSRYLAFVEFRDHPRAGIHLLELGPEGWFLSQQQRSDLLQYSVISEFIPQIVNRSGRMSSGAWVLLYELKGCPSGARTLSSYLRGPQSDSLRLSQELETITQGLFKWNEASPPGTTTWFRDGARDLLLKTLRATLNHDQWGSSDLIDYVQRRVADVVGNDAVTAEALLFDDCPVLLPNPISYLSWTDLWPTGLVMPWPQGSLLGRVETQSILVTGNPDVPIFFMNIEDYHEGLVFLDWFYLEIDILLNSLHLDSHLGWKEFISLIRELTTELQLGAGVHVTGGRSSQVLKWLDPLRSRLVSMIEQMAQSGVSRTDIELAAWLGAVASGLQIAVEDSNRSPIERKGALFYAANALTSLLPRSPRGEPVFRAQKAVQVRRTMDLETPVGAQQLDEYISWVAVGGGATGRVISGLEEWFVDPDTRVARVVGVRHYDEVWLIDLEQQWGSDFQPEKRRRLNGTEDLKRFIAEQHRVVLLGEPGSGKTTLLEYLFLSYGKVILEAASPIPVLVRLGSFRGEQSFEDFILTQIGNLREHFDRLKGRLVLLCDALNEMPHVGYGPDKRNLIDEVRNYLENTTITWVLSCRVRDYVYHDLNQVGRGVKRVELLPLDIPRIRQIIWMKFRNLPKLAEGLWSELCGGEQFVDIIPRTWNKFELHGDALRFWDWRGIHALQALTAAPQYLDPHEQTAWNVMHERKLMRLCQNPYMLKLVALVYVDNVRAHRPMPNVQGQIIHQVASNLIDDELKKHASGVQDHEKLKAKIMQALRVIAFAMQTHEETLQTETEITRLAALAAVEDNDLAEPERLVELATSAQILTSDQFKLRFSHQLMQEYFAGMTLVNALHSGSPSSYWPAASWWEPSRLDETAVILVGWYQEWQSVVRWIAQANPELAAECLNRNDRSFEELDPDTRILIHDAIQQKLEKSTSVQERAAAFRALGWIGDTRPGVGLTPDGIPDILWSKPIPASDFIMGGDPDALKSWDGLVQSIEHEYFVSRYLVTVAQYHAFIKDGGYTERWWQCWTHDGWEWKQRMKKVCPYAWNNPRWAVPNHPVIGVTWYEAFAFSRWLDAKLRSISTMPDSHLEIRLPTEAEWEKCARGPEGRLYPWGNEFQPELANVRETSGVNRTSAVGLFGERAASIYGIEDLAGNVWEWCLSQWREQYQPEDFISLTGDKPRSSRGGSWFHGSKHARAASRFWYRPGVADFCWGFRVCASGPVKFATT